MSVQEQDIVKQCFKMLSQIITTTCRHALAEDTSSQLGEDMVCLIFSRHTTRNTFLDISTAPVLQGDTAEVAKLKRKRKSHCSSPSAVGSSGVFITRKIVSLLLHSLKHCPSFRESSYFGFYVEKLFTVTKQLISQDYVYCDGIGR